MGRKTCYVGPRNSAPRSRNLLEAGWNIRARGFPRFPSKEKCGMDDAAQPRRGERAKESAARDRASFLFFSVGHEPNPAPELVSTFPLQHHPLRRGGSACRASSGRKTQRLAQLRPWNSGARQSPLVPKSLLACLLPERSAESSRPPLAPQIRASRMTKPGVRSSRSELGTHPAPSPRRLSAQS